ncbi:MAG: tyrosine-type recombinase/integrase [Chloroflexi bacterium]|nr:tyrosine-type recombinase/integrase [Chloroflexota bacterium]
MLDQIKARQADHRLSTRQLARQLEVSPSLLSMVLNGKREPSKKLVISLTRWLSEQVSSGPQSPSSVYRRFISEKRSQLAELTAKFYEAKLAPFTVWCEQFPLPIVSEIGREHISEFLAHIRAGRRARTGGVKPLSNGALKLHHQTLKTFFNYVGETCDVPETWKNPVDGIKVKGSQSQTLEYSDTEIQRMFEVIESNTDKLLSLRNSAMLTVLLNSAVRASELLAMNVVDIGQDGRTKVTGKGSKQRLVTIGQSGQVAVTDYPRIRGNHSGALWQTFDGNRLTSDGLRGVFNRIADTDPDVFTDGLYAHRFRHTAITRLLRARVPLRSVQRYAGHSDPQTTLRYAQAIDVDEAIAAVETLNY